jgi:hypothetical protein
MMASILPMALVGLCLASAASAGDLLDVDLELILAVDVSRSIDGDEHRLQREGYVAAFRHPDLLQAIKSGPFGRIAVVYFEWAGSRHQSVVVPWSILSDNHDLEAFAGDLEAQPILPEAGTSISSALMFAERIFTVSGVRGLRRAIDVSGDGPNNDGPAIEPVRRRLIADGVAINGLPIKTGSGGGRGDLTDYFARSVIGGPRAFAITVDDKSRFADSIRRKLVLEIGWLPTPPVPVSFVSADGASNRPNGRQRHGGGRQTRSAYNSLQ